MISERKYITVFFAAIAISVFAISLFNFVVDPYRIFNAVALKGFNDEKPEIRTRRLFVPLELAREQADIIVLGSSRGAAIHEAAQAYWPNKSVRNSGISALRAREAAEFLTFYAERADTQHILFVSDFFGFNDHVRFDLGYIPTIISEGRLWRLRAMAVFSVSTLVASIKTVGASMAMGAQAPTIGAIAGDPVADQTKADKKSQDAALREACAFQLTKYLQSPRFYKNFALDQTAFDELAGAFRKVIASGKKLTVILGPSHALQWEAIAKSGNWADFEIWKRKMSALANNTGVEIWDFASYSATSSLPLAASAEHYEDSSHYRTRTATTVLECIFTGKTCAELDGVLLNGKDIEARLQEVRQKRTAWRQVRAGSPDLTVLFSPSDAVR